MNSMLNWQLLIETQGETIEASFPYLNSNEGVKLNMQLVAMNNRPIESITILLCASNMNKANEVLQIAQDLEVKMVVMCKDLVKVAKNNIWHVNNMCGNNECAKMAIGWMSPCNTPSQQLKVVQKLQLQHNFGGSLLPFWGTTYIRWH
jgi:hypothetical protein